MNEKENIIELMEDIQVVSPGEMLREAREKMGLTQDFVTKRLNFRRGLVDDIETDNFDKKISETYNRGYLRSYAKLVNVAEDDIIASYENLNIAELQCAEMQSFSKGTVKQAENTLLMWASFLIVALLFVATIVWWMQSTSANNTSVIKTEINAEPANETVPALNSAETVAGEVVETDVVEQAQVSEPNVSQKLRTQLTMPSKVVKAQPTAEVIETASLSNEENMAPTSANDNIMDAQFTFLGDCWVNIHDATGERVAWGVKKSGYVMNISGVAPFAVTLGKPELVKINLAGEDIDTNKFARGNIAKFSLPLDEG